MRRRPRSSAIKSKREAHRVMWLHSNQQIHDANCATKHALMSSASSLAAHKRVAHIVQQLAPQPTAAATVPKAKFARPVTLAAHLATLTPIIGSDQALPSLLLSLAAASAEISSILRGSTVAKIGSANEFGDMQLNVDVDTHEVS